MISWRESFLLVFLLSALVPLSYGGTELIKAKPETSEGGSSSPQKAGVSSSKVRDLYTKDGKTFFNGVEQWDLTPDNTRKLLAKIAWAKHEKNRMEGVEMAARASPSFRSSSKLEEVPDLIRAKQRTRREELRLKLSKELQGGSRGNSTKAELAEVGAHIQALLKSHEVGNKWTCSNGESDPHACYDLIKENGLSICDSLFCPTCKYSELCQRDCGWCAFHDPCRDDIPDCHHYIPYCDTYMRPGQEMEHSCDAGYSKEEQEGRHFGSAELIFRTCGFCHQDEHPARLPMRPLCPDVPDQVRDALNGCEQYAEHCDDLFCKGCSYEGKCDYTCGFCKEDNTVQTVYDPNCSDGLEDCKAYESLCLEDLCPTCEYAHQCDKTCMFCSDDQALQHLLR